MRNIRLWDELTRFLKENFDVDDINSLSNESYQDLCFKLAAIEIEETEKDESDGDDESGYSQRGEMASAILTEISWSFKD